MNEPQAAEMKLDKVIEKVIEWTPCDSVEQCTHVDDVLRFLCSCHLSPEKVAATDLNIFTDTTALSKRFIMRMERHKHKIQQQLHTQNQKLLTYDTE